MINGIEIIDVMLFNGIKRMLRLIISGYVKFEEINL